MRKNQIFGTSTANSNILPAKRDPDLYTFEAAAASVAWGMDIPSATRRSRGRLVQSVLECFAGLELGLAGGGDGHRLARPGVAGLPCCAGSDRERAEARQPELVTPLQRIGDCREQAIDRLLGIALAEPAIAGDDGNQLASVHSVPTE